ncbi:MAG: hypothetical protein JNJ90_10625 [Saprospiraceae bacterium]|jgi:hypothetical protein|nr:hypothetical protein [Saprospiraceae bacterium]
MKSYRYPGPRPFPENYRALFFGREKEVAELHRLVRREPWVVLYGKSGLGKSSLLNAGLAPRLAVNDAMSPVFIRFGAWTPDRSDAPLDIAADVLDAPPTNWLEELVPGDRSLWRVLKDRQLARLDTGPVLLVFDQFEELFTFHFSAVEAFAKSLAEVFYTNIPERYRVAIENTSLLDEARLRLLHESLAIRVVTAIRTDRMALMHQLKPFLPSTLDVCYELRPLARAAAEEAVLNPAFDSSAFRTPRFDYEDAALDALLDFLSAGNSQDIESFQLQILCEHLEKNTVELDGRTRITASDLADPEGILENYYIGKINEIEDPEARLAARHLIEEGLIFEEEERRLSLFEGQIQHVWGVGIDLLAQLEDTHLLRREPSLRGGYTYELSHDTLVAPVLKAKHSRLDQETQEEAARLTRLREAELSAAKAEAAREKQRRQRAAFLAWAAGVAAILALTAAVIAWEKTEAAKQAEEVARTAQQKAETAQKTAEENLFALQQEKARALEDQADEFYRYHEYDSAIYEYEQALKLLPPEAKEPRERLTGKLESCQSKLKKTK